jgi:hypothetical protein
MVFLFSKNWKGWRVGVGAELCTKMKSPPDNTGSISDQEWTMETCDIPKWKFPNNSNKYVSVVFKCDMTKDELHFTRALNVRIEEHVCSMYVFVSTLIAKQQQTSTIR